MACIILCFPGDDSKRADDPVPTETQPQATTQVVTRTTDTSAVIFGSQTPRPTYSGNYQG